MMREGDCVIDQLAGAVGSWQGQLAGAVGSWQEW